MKNEFKTTFASKAVCLLILSVLLLGNICHAAASGSPSPAKPAGYVLKGTVVNAQGGAPSVGATVMVKGTTNGGYVAADGTYSIEVNGDQTLIVSMIGYITQEIPINSRVRIDVTLQEDVMDIEEVVFVGYGAQKKQTITGAIASVGTEELLRSPSANVTNTLAGRIPGLTTIQRSGEPGSDGATLRVRGIGTLRDGDEAAPLIVIDGVERSSLDLIDANEIETINVLKDASATAVYGVRGANGVILVTTRQGDKGRPQVSVSSNFGWQTYTMMPEMVNSYDYVTLYNEGIDNENSTLAKFPEEIIQKYKDHSSPVIYPDVDWIELLFNDSAPVQKYNVNVSGGTDRVSYFVSYGMTHQTGMFKEYPFEGIDFSMNPDYSRQNLRANLNIDVTDRLKLGMNVSSVFTNGYYSGMNTSLIFDYLLRTTPHSNPGIVDGKIISGYSGDDPLEGMRLGENVFYRALSEGYKEVNSTTFNITANLSYDMSFLLKGLSLNGRVAYDDYGEHSVAYKTTIPLYSVMITDTDDPDGYELVRTTDESSFNASESYGSRYRNVYLEGSVNYNLSVRFTHLTAMVLYNQKTSMNPSYAYSLPKGLLGLVSRVTYNYDNRYLAEFNLGYNGSENFAEGKRFGLFPAVSAGWIITEEPFFPKNQVLTYLKLRGSYGEVGNDQIGGQRYMYLPSSFQYGVNGYNFGTYGVNSQFYSGSKEGVAGNSDVTWERARKANVAVDVKMFSNRLTFTGDLFQEKRDNILWDYGTVTALVGTTLAAANLGKVDNHGFEMDLRWSDKIGDDFVYYLSGTFSYAKNKIIYKDEPEPAYDYMYETGYSVGQYKGYVNEGFINTTADLENQPAHSWGSLWDKGELNFIDVNGDGIVDTNDRVTIGYGPTPEVNYSFSLGFNWKNFEFSTLWQGVTNVSVYLKQSAVYAMYYGRTVQQWHMGRWTEERYLAGEEITYPRVLSLNTMSPSFIDQNPLSTYWLYDASYLRLRNLEIAYNLRSERLKKVGISNARFYVNGSNLLTFSPMKNFDPEAPSGVGTFYPAQKVYNVGFNIIF